MHRVNPFSRITVPRWRWPFSISRGANWQHPVGPSPEAPDELKKLWVTLGKAYVDGLYDDEGCRREKRSLEDKLANLVVPGVDAAMEVGNLLENLPVLWQEADLTERRKLLMAMLDAVYVDTVEEKRIVAIRPKPAFRPLLEIATTREGSDIVLVDDTKEGEDLGVAI
jgi:site-specific DNA recombinase